MASYSWTRASNGNGTRPHAQRQRNRTRRQAPIRSHVLGFRRNNSNTHHHTRTWRQAFLPSRTTSDTTTDATAATPTSPSLSASFFRLGRRVNVATPATTTTTGTTTTPSHPHKPDDNKAPLSPCGDIESLLDLLKALRRRDPRVQQVVLDGTPLPWQYTAALLRAVGGSPHVWRVQLRRAGADDRVAAALRDCVRRSPVLIDLDVSRNRLGRPAMEALRDAWRDRARQQHHHHDHGVDHACPLQRLNLEGNPLDDSALRVLSHALTAGATPNLQILRLGRNPRCGVEGITVLCRELLGAPACPVTWLDVRGNRLGDAGIWPLAQALSEPACPLEYLSLQRNNISDEGVAAIAQAMEGNTRLQTLDLQRNPDLDDEGAAALVDALWHNHSFTKLKIRHTRVRDMRVKNELFDLLVMNTYGPTLAASTKESLQHVQQQQTDASGSSPSATATTQPCVICFEASRTVGHTFGILLPCRHDNACWACCQRLRGHCHMCRTPIVKIVAA